MHCHYNAQGQYDCGIIEHFATPAYNTTRTNTLVTTPRTNTLVPTPRSNPPVYTTPRANPPVATPRTNTKKVDCKLSAWQLDNTNKCQNIRKVLTQPSGSGATCGPLTQPITSNNTDCCASTIVSKYGNGIQDTKTEAKCNNLKSVAYGKCVNDPSKYCAYKLPCTPNMNCIYKVCDNTNSCVKNLLV